MTGKITGAQDQKTGVLFIEDVPQIMQAFDKAKVKVQLFFYDIVVTWQFQYGETDTDSQLR